MTTQINGKNADWTPEIYAEFNTRVIARLHPTHSPTDIKSANYFTPRPYVDEYNRGSDRAGFTWVIKRDVYQTSWVQS